MLELIERYGVSSIEAHILELLLKLAKNGWVTNLTCGQIAKKLRVSVSTVKRYLAKLEDRGLIEKKVLRAADGKTRLNVKIKGVQIELPNNNNFVDIYRQHKQQQTNNGGQIEPGIRTKPLGEEEKEAVRLIVQNDLRLKRIPLHKVVFFLLNSPLSEEETLRAIENADANPEIRNPVGFLVVYLRVSRESSTRWEWLTSPDEAVPGELLSFYEECLEEKEKMEEEELRRELAEEIRSFAKTYGLELPELDGLSSDELEELKKKLIVRAGKKLLTENPELKPRFRKLYEDVRKMPGDREFREYVFYSGVLEFTEVLCRKEG